MVRDCVGTVERGWGGGRVDSLALQTHRAAHFHASNVHINDMLMQYGRSGKDPRAACPPTCIGCMRIVGGNVGGGHVIEEWEGGCSPE